MQPKICVCVCVGARACACLSVSVRVRVPTYKRTYSFMPTPRPFQVLDQRVPVHGAAGRARVPVDGPQPGVPVQHRARAVGQVAGGPVAPVQQHAVPDPVAGVPRHAVAAAAARAPLPAHAVPAAQTAPVGAVLRGRVSHHVVVSSKCRGRRALIEGSYGGDASENRTLFILTP